MRLYFAQTTNTQIKMQIIKHIPRITIKITAAIISFYSLHSSAVPHLPFVQQLCGHRELEQILFMQSELYDEHKSFEEQHNNAH